MCGCDCPRTCHRKRTAGRIETVAVACSQPLYAFCGLGFCASSVTCARLHSAYATLPAQPFLQACRTCHRIFVRFSQGIFFVKKIRIIVSDMCCSWGLDVRQTMLSSKAEETSSAAPQAPQWHHPSTSKATPADESNGADGGTGQSSSSKQRLRWTPELHDRFVNAVTQLGGADSKGAGGWEGDKKQDWRGGGGCLTGRCLLQERLPRGCSE